MSDFGGRGFGGLDGGFSGVFSGVGVMFDIVGAGGGGGNEVEGLLGEPRLVVGLDGVRRRGVLRRHTAGTVIPTDPTIHGRSEEGGLEDLV